MAAAAAAAAAMTSGAKRIVFTGGSGKAGRHVIPYLIGKGHSVLNLDLIPANLPGVFDLKTDLTDSGQVFNALTSHFSFQGYERGAPPGPPDIVIHFAAMARNLLVPDSETFRVNALSTYNVIEAACKLGVRKIVIASSETVYGVCFAEGDVDYHSFPLDEDYDVDPMDTYAISKLCGERVARGFARRFPTTDIYAFRIGNVIEPHEYSSLFPAYVANPASRKRNAWSYIDARDLGQMCELAARSAGGLGFQVFNATNDTNTLREPTAGFLAREFPQVPRTRELGEWEAPLSNRKIREVLGFREEHDWRKYYRPE